LNIALAFLVPPWLFRKKTQIEHLKAYLPHQTLNEQCFCDFQEQACWESTFGRYHIQTSVHVRDSGELCWRENSKPGQEHKIDTHQLKFYFSFNWFHIG
jgi:hypothetical protein